MLTTVMSILYRFLVLIVLLINYFNAERVSLRCDQIRHFVDGHNLRRQLVATGAVPGQPPASNMRNMIWDEELADKAAKWADNGKLSHNPNRALSSNRWSLVGENIYMAKYYSNINTTVTPNIEQALDSWFNEYKNYGFTPFSLNTLNPIGHYTQMAWANSTHLGCGISQRKENDWTLTLFVCDYGPTGNFIGKVPYESTNVPGYLHCPRGECAKPYGSYC